MNKFTMRTGTIKTMGAFADTIKRCVKLSLGENYEVQIQESRKNNDVLLTGILIKEKNARVAPVIHLDGAFEAYKNGSSLVSICNEIIRVYKENNNAGMCDISEIMEYEKIRDKICYRLVNAERNKAMLEETPHVIFHDLAIIFYVEVFQNAETRGTLTVSNEMMKVWKKNALAIVKDAVANTEAMLEGSVVHMMDLLEKLQESLAVNLDFEDFSNIGFKELFPMYVASNKTGVNGAAVMLYTDFLENFADEISNSFYILPSSIHELIFIPAYPDMDIEYFKSMVKEINILSVLPEEVLSDSIYYFDRESGLLIKM